MREFFQSFYKSDGDSEIAVAIFKVIGKYIASGFIKRGQER